MRAPKPALGRTAIQRVVDDSRIVERGDFFVSAPSASGNDEGAGIHLRQAIHRGAAAVLVPRGMTVPENTVPPVLRSEQVRTDLACLASAMHGWPARKLAMNGVTGTNGKTTTSFLLKGILARAGRPCALFGTVGYFLPRRRLPAPNTTPGSLALQGLLSSALEQGAKAAVMEVSSHALQQERVEGIEFKTAIFTNLTQDHLDYHKTMRAYGAAKARLFGKLKRDGTAVLNAEDKAWPRMARARRRGSRVLSFHAGGGKADLQALHCRFSALSTRFVLAYEGRLLDLQLPLPGPYNVANALAAAGAALAQGVAPDAVAAGLERPLVPPGRYELVQAGQPFSVVVDYAHTPDALERLIKAARAITPGRVITVFGCGGDRDPGKRPTMGHLAAANSDLVVATSDNPRSEDPEEILDQVLAGIRQKRGQVQHVLRISDRRQAIGRALKLAKAGDCVLLAGKGHEDYQVLKGGKTHFDDREEARRALSALGWHRRTR